MQVAKAIRAAGHEVFDDWISAGPTTDDDWRDYELARGRTYIEALEGWHAKNVFEFDHRHIQRADAGVLVCPAGKSAHLELGYMIGRGKRGYILLEENHDRWDIMYGFATGVCGSLEDLIGRLEND